MTQQQIENSILSALGWLPENLRRDAARGDEKAKEALADAEGIFRFLKMDGALALME